MINSLVNTRVLNIHLHPLLCCQGDRVVLGGEYYFRFNHPLRAGEEGSRYSKGQGTFEYARNELIQAQTAR